MKRLKFALLSIALLACGISANAQENLFNVISDAQAGLSPDEYTKLLSLRENPVYESITMIQVGDLPSLQRDGIILINLPGLSTYKAIADRIENPSVSESNLNATTGDFTWEGSFEIDTVINDSPDTIGDGNITLYRKDGEMYGTIRPPFSSDVYELASFGPGKNAIIKYNTSYLQGFSCGNDVATDPVQRVAGGPCNNKVRVLVLYTHAAMMAVPNIGNTINTVIGDLNGAIANSTPNQNNADLSFELAGKKEVDFSEYCYQCNRIDNLLSTEQNDPNIKNERDAVKADIVVLLTDRDYDNNLAGYSNIDASSEMAYAVINADQASVNYGFVHEVGHVMGARHQESEDPATVYAHGYDMNRGWVWNGPSNYITVMYVNGSNSYQRSHLFSTPDRQFWGHDMGDATHNNAKVLFDNACDVASFRPDDNIAFKVKISDISPKRLTNQNVQLKAIPSNGLSPYLFQWFKSSDGFHWQLVSSGSNDVINFPMPAKQTYITLFAFDFGTSQASSAATTLYNSSLVILSPYQYTGYNGEIGPARKYIQASEDNSLTVYPNPASNSFNANVKLSSEELNKNHTLTVTDALGRTIYTQNEIYDYETNLTIDASSYAKGIYFVKLTGGNQPRVIKITIAD